MVCSIFSGRRDGPQTLGDRVLHGLQPLYHRLYKTQESAAAAPLPDSAQKFLPAEVSAALLPAVLGWELPYFLFHKLCFLRIDPARDFLQQFQ